MTFLSPLFLIGISAFALPLIIHLVFKKKAKIVPFPSIVFLREIDREVVRKKRIEEILVMILRMLVLILFALFLSKPVLKANIFGAGSKAVVIILDDSFSMNAVNGHRRFDLAKEKARLLISSLGRGDRAALFLTSRSPGEGFRKGILSGDRLAMTRWIEALPCGYGLTDLDMSFLQAQTLLRSSRTKNRGIFLITDLQKRDWDTIAHREKTKDIPLILIDVSSESNPLNVAITNVEILSTPEKRLGRTFTFRIETKDFSTRAFEGRLGMHDTRGSVIAETPLNVPAQSTVEKELRFHPAGEGWHSGYFAVEKDDLETDNRRYYALEVSEGIPVGIFNQVRITPPDFDEVFFLTKLIDPTGQNYPFAPEEFFVISGETLGKYRVAVFPSLLKLRAGEMAALQNYVSSGGRVIFFLKEGFSVETLRSLFGQITTSEGFEDGLFKIGEEGLGLQNLFLDVDFYRRVVISTSGIAGGTAISLFQDGNPFLIEKRVGSGRLMLFTCGFHIDYTNLPFRHASLPLMYNLLYRLAGKREGLKYTVGESLVVRPDWVSVTTAAGETVPLDPKSAFFKLSAPGIYEVRGEGASAHPVIEQVPVNVNPEEGDLTAITSDGDIERSLPFTQWERVRSDEDLRAKLQDIISGTPLWSYFLFAAVAAFLAELYLANKIGQKV
jgi:hypothetical protein